MMAICVEDERILMEDTVEMCLELPEITEAKGFTHAAEALEWLENNRADLALLDIDMPEMNGIELAARIKGKCPETAVIFLTGYAQYAVQAFSVRASGYLLKPITKEALAADVTFALSEKAKRLVGHIVVHTFGNFDVFVDGEPISFKLAKCKEMLAYLVDRQGYGVTRPELFSIVWENSPYDRKNQKLFDVYIRALRESLRNYGIEDIFVMNKGVIRIKPEMITCDAYLFYSGSVSAVNSYKGEYMSGYSWASITESMLYWKSMSGTQ